jgi:hypothetical protein
MQKVTKRPEEKKEPTPSLNGPPTERALAK